MPCIDDVLLFEIITIISELKGRQVNRSDWRQLVERAGGEKNLVWHMRYLEQKKFIKSGYEEGADDSYQISLSLIKILKDGLDFLRSDSAIANYQRTVIVKFHADILTMLENFIQKDETIPSDDKTRIVSKLRELPFVAIEHLTKKLLDLGLANAEGAWPLIRTFF